MTQHDDPQARAPERRLEEIEAGLREGVRREIARLRTLGLPVYVAEDGRIAERPETKTPEKQR